MPRPSRLHVAEPAPSYAQRPAAVVDASVLCAVVFVEPEIDEALARAGAHRLLAPHLLPYEVANVAVMRHRRGEPLDDLQSALQRLAALDLSLETVLPAGTLDLAARYALTAYDAAYLWLAAAHRAPLLTFDRRLAEAARQHLSKL
jgi:predicted nucleic acid-binding protein